MWNILDRFAEHVRLYSTPVGQLWNTVTFVFRLFIIVAVGSSVYGDEQGNLICDTNQPGCKNVCFNRFSPISHMRFWAFQILFVSIPSMIFYLYTSTQNGRVEKYEEVRSKLLTGREKANNLKQELEQQLLDAQDFDEKGENGIYPKNSNFDGKSFDGKSLAELSTQLDSQAAEVMLKEKRAMKLRKRIGRYKKKEVAEQLKGGKVVQVIWSTQIRVWYLIHCVIKFSLEVMFFYLMYLLQQQQSHRSGLAGWIVPEKYTCMAGFESACNQQEKVTCWVSRPWEKQIFLIYMIIMSFICIVLSALEFVWVLCRTTRKHIKRKAAARKVIDESNVMGSKFRGNENGFHGQSSKGPHGHSSQNGYIGNSYPNALMMGYYGMKLKHRNMHGNQHVNPDLNGNFNNNLQGGANSPWIYAGQPIIENYAEDARPKQNSDKEPTLSNKSSQD